MYCKYLSKKVNGGFKCKKYKQGIISLDKCKNCLEFDLKRNKPIKKISKKRITVSKETYNKVLKRDKEKCRLCGTNKNLHLHHINGRGKDLTNNINNCIMLCQHCHLEIVHKNQKKYRPILLQIINKEDI
jgi:5-methylcytosine-specific restriction endonuclease McrA